MKNPKIVNLELYEQVRNFDGDTYQGRCLAAEWSNVKSNLYYMGWNARRADKITGLYINFIAKRRNAK